MSTIPPTIGDADLAWVANALACGNVPGAADLVGIAREPMGAGAGFFGDLARLRLSYGRRCRGAPDSLILKLASRHPATRARAKRFGLYRREVCFYKAGGLGFPVPRCYGATVDPSGERFALLLEDLSHLAHDDQLRGISPAHALLVAEAIASAQAPWWGSSKLEELNWLPLQSEQALAAAYRTLWPAFLELHGRALPSGSVELGARVRDGFDVLLEQNSRPPLTVVHGDVRADNIYFTARAAVFLDWQLCVRCHGIFDVAYMLTQSMDVEARRSCEDAVVRRWHDVMVRRGVARCSLDDAIADYRRCALVGLGYAVAGATLERDGDRGNALARAQAVRAFTAALDLH